MISRNAARATPDCLTRTTISRHRRGTFLQMHESALDYRPRFVLKRIIRLPDSARDVLRSCSYFFEMRVPGCYTTSGTGFRRHVDQPMMHQRLTSRLVNSMPGVFTACVPVNDHFRPDEASEVRFYSD